MPAVNRLAVHFSSKSSEWETPQDFFELMNTRYGPFDLDACASHSNAKCLNYYTKEGSYHNDRGFWHKVAKDTGLVGRWHAFGKCWMNPPYGREIGKWVKKAYEESQKGAVVVCLLPARTDTKWFHTYCKMGEITFIRGRLKFGGAKNSAPFPSMVVVFR